MNIPQVQRVLSTLIIVSTGLLLAAGCAAQKAMTITSDPSSAQVRITADRNKASNDIPTKDFLIGETPLTHSFQFGSSSQGPSMYNVEFSRAGYEKKTVVVRKQDTETTLKVTLDKEVVKDVPKLVLVVSENKGYVLEKRAVRAWIEDIEREGMAASSVIRLNENQSILGMALSADGATLYFALAEPVTDGNGQSKMMANLRSVSSRGGGITQLTSGQWLDATPTCSPDGQYLIFSSNRIQNNKPDLFRISAEQTGGIAVIRQSSEGANYQPSASQGNLIVFTYKPKYSGQLSGNDQIWTVGGEASYPTQLRNGNMPAISPDGKEIAFISEGKQLWKMPITGQNPVQLTSEKVNIDGKKHPAWTPDGKFIVFSSDVGKDNKGVPNYDIWIIPKDGGEPRQLTTNGSEDDYPLVSTDHKFIYFVSNRGFKEGIWRISFPTMETKSGAK